VPWPCWVSGCSVSLYRFLRTSALLALAGRYRQKLFLILVAVAVATVSSWLYDDVASYLESQHPEFVLMALILKTLIVYGVLVYVVWQLRPSGWAAEPESSSTAQPASTASEEPGPLDELMDKPKLKTRKHSLLDQISDEK
jgi:hypothetical protein